MKTTKKKLVKEFKVFLKKKKKIKKATIWLRTTQKFSRR